MATPLPKHIIDEIRKRSIFDSIIRNHIENSIKNEHPMFQSFVKNHSIFFGEYQGETENKPMPTFYHFSRPFIKKKMKGDCTMTELRDGDIIEFNVNGKRLDYKAVFTGEVAFLSNQTQISQLKQRGASACNAAIFEVLGFNIDDSEHFEWCKQIYGYTPLNEEDDNIIDFPEAKSLEDLRRVVQNLEVLCNKTNKSKKGDVKDEQKVKIEDLHIGQTVYLHGKTPGKIIAINGEMNSIVVRIRGDVKGEKHKWHIKDITLSPGFDFSDLETVRSLHRELWEWLEARPNCSKRNWPRWKNRGGDVPLVENMCFYCEYAKIVSGEDQIIDYCRECPGDWKVKNDEMSMPPCCNGAFGIWNESDGINVRKMAAEIIKNS